MTNPYKKETDIDYLEDLQASMYGDCVSYNDCLTCPHANGRFLDCDMIFIVKRIKQLKKEQKNKGEKL